MSTLQERIEAEIKSYFPDAEIKRSVEPPEFITFGIAENNKPITHEFMHSRFLVISNEGLDEAELEMIDELKDLKFYKQPDYIFIRSICEDKYADLKSDNICYSIQVRFTLGYKI